MSVAEALGRLRDLPADDELSALVARDSGPLGDELSALVAGDAGPADEAVLESGRARELVAAAVARLDRERDAVVDEQRYAWTRVLVARLGGAHDLPYFPHVAEGERDRLLGGFFPSWRRAAVALPVTGGDDPRLLVIRRSIVNGHTGGPMADAGEIALFGGALEPGEPSVLAALREFGEEAGIAGVLDDPRFDPWPALCTWRTEGGYTASAHVVRVLGDAAADLRPDLRELAAIGVLPLERLYGLPVPQPRAHVRIGLGRGRRPLFVGWFDSPTVTVDDPDGRSWELFGLAGAAVRALRLRHPSLDALREACDRRGRVRARLARPEAPADDLVVRAARVRALLDGDLAVGTPPILAAPLLGELFGAPAVLAVDAALGLGGSSKARVVAGLVQAVQEARAERGLPAGLAAAFTGATLLCGSTGSHARAVAALARWLEAGGATGVRCEFFVSRDIPDVKHAALRTAGHVTVCSDFNDATGRAYARERELTAAGGRALVLPCDPDDRLNEAAGLWGGDGSAGFATLLLDVAQAVRERWKQLGLDGPRVDELVVPTSGGATFAACLASYRGQASDAVDRTGGTGEVERAGGTDDTAVGAVAAVYDRAAPCLKAALAGGDADIAVEVDWSSSISGLAQPKAAPGVLPLIAGEPATLRPVTRAAAQLAQRLIALEIGLWPEAAGAATVGAQLLQACAEQGAGFAPRVLGLVSGHRRGGTVLPDVERLLPQVAADAAAVRPGPDGSRSRVYVVSGAACPQSAALLDDLVAEYGGLSAMPAELRACHDAARGASESSEPKDGGPHGR